ncbi:hypothetical protein BJ912DRAFT_1087811 [Pholiota molesta]|nr:hypothetical protein BJ912DRAFT_1087811 [Pholiota molesta]
MANNDGWMADGWMDGGSGRRTMRDSLTDDGGQPNDEPFCIAISVFTPDRDTYHPQTPPPPTHSRLPHRLIGRRLALPLVGRPGRQYCLGKAAKIAIDGAVSARDDGIACGCGAATTIEGQRHARRCLRQVDNALAVGTAGHGCHDNDLVSLRLQLDFPPRSVPGHGRRRQIDDHALAKCRGREFIRPCVRRRGRPSGLLAASINMGSPALLGILTYLGHASPAFPHHPPPSTSVVFVPSKPLDSSAHDTICKGIAADVIDQDDDGAPPLLPHHRSPSPSTAFCDDDSSIAGTSNAANQPKMESMDNMRRTRWCKGAHTGTFTATRTVLRLTPSVDACASGPFPLFSMPADALANKPTLSEKYATKAEFEHLRTEFMHLTVRYEQLKRVMQRLLSAAATHPSGAAAAAHTMLAPYYHPSSSIPGVPGDSAAYSPGTSVSPPRAWGAVYEDGGVGGAGSPALPRAPRWAVKGSPLVLASIMSPYHGHLEGAKPTTTWVWLRLR